MANAGSALLTGFIVFGGLFAGSFSFAAVPKSAEFGLSLMSHQMYSLTTQSSGKKDTLGTSFYHIAMQYHQPVNQVLLSPWLRYMPESLHSVKSPNKSSTTSITALGLPVTMNYRGGFDFGTGPVLVRYTIHAFGSGTEVLSNGESSSEFFQPTESKTAVTLAWQLGTGWTSGSFRGAADILINGMLSSKKRNVSGLVTGAWIYGK